MSSWKNQLKKACQENYPHEGYFGGSANFNWPIKQVTQYLTKLEKLGVSNIEIIDCDKIRFELPSPCDSSEALIYILTYEIKPSSVIYNRKKDISYTLTLKFRN